MFAYRTETQEPMLVKIEPGGELPSDLFHHKGDEFILILRGELQLEIANDKRLLREGDSVYIDSIIPAVWRNLGEIQVQAVWVLSPPIT